MNIVNKLTLRHMKQNKRRTLVTIIGVIISVAMITAVMTLGISFQDLLKRQVMAESGEWHTLYHNANSEQIDVIANDEATKTLMLSQTKGFVSLEDMGLKGMYNKPYITVRAYDNNGLSKFPISVVEGRLPQNEKEIVVPQHYLTDVTGAEIAPGDEIELSIGTRYLKEGTWPKMEERSNFGDDTAAYMTDSNTLDEYLEVNETNKYTVVGIIEKPVWENSWQPGYTFITYIDQSLLAADETANVSVITKKVENSVYTNTEALASELGLKYNVNYELLRYDFVSSNNGFIAAMYSLTVIIMAIVIVGSVSLIYNAFGISVADRSRYLGMLASVGATRRQKRNSVFFEGFVISVISIPIGLLGGLLGLTITFWSINSMVKDLFGVSETLLVRVTPLTIIVSVAISLLTIFLSTWWPAKRASKVSAIDAIRQTQDVKLSKKKVKTSKLVRKMFGIEAEIALKNLKRNKRRYQITVFSLVISIILFLTVSFFTNTMTQSMDISNDGINYDIVVGSHNSDSTEVIDTVIQLEDVTAYNYLHSTYVQTDIPLDQLPPAVVKMVEQDPTMLTNGKYRFHIDLYAMSDEALTKYAQDNRMDVDALFDESKRNAILMNVNNYYSQLEQKKISDVPILNGKGTTLDLNTQVEIEEKLENGESEYHSEEVALPSLHIAEVTSEYPMGILKSNGGPNSLTLLVSQGVMQQLVGDQEGTYIRHEVYLSSSDPKETEKQISELDNMDGYYISNVYESRQRDQQMVVLIGVFTYGFIALITLISIANILNTISTGIQLRKREFAMLRSMGMTKKGFYRMINYESIFYGLKSLLYGLPLSLLVMYLIYRSMSNAIDYSFQLPWVSIAIAIIAVFIIVSLSMLYSGSKVKKGSIVEAIKQENM
ncbi:MAG: ABC transporter permease [Candidatus Pristimantibacillus lignocellulolyticus]|uniref:ABC transporter permease n=1 Tax=Candidatus Pristimantibacillus lignocellulolyticus TaxID=2994561 RepID=A0A9J6ZJS3_9BACL|nr:MAG: ABC transporter permease [Candidatus Pristimantibacillus lignocellulolyticus]